MVWRDTFRHPALLTAQGFKPNGTYFGIPLFSLFWGSYSAIRMSASVEELGRLYLAQLTKGCKNDRCCNMDCGRNRSREGSSPSVQTEADKKAIVQRAIRMAKYGTVFSCSYVNRAFACDDDSMDTFVDTSILGDVKVCERVVKLLSSDLTHIIECLRSLSKRTSTSRLT